MFVGGKAIGTTEATPEGDTLTGVEEQPTKYVFGLRSGCLARFGIEYDGWEAPIGKNPAYTAIRPVNGMSGRWQKQNFEIQKPRFQNSQNHNADFRLQIFTPEFFLRQVTFRRG